MRLIACEVIKSELEFVAKELGGDISDYNPMWLKQDLHDEPEKLRAELSRIVNETKDETIILGFGLCSNAVEGLEAGESEIIIPRAHDCITLYLGSNNKYLDEHATTPGTYWFSRGFIHRPDGAGVMMGHAPGAEGSMNISDREKTRQEFIEKYGEDEADYLMEVWVDSWKANYSRAVMLTWNYPELEDDRKNVKQMADENGWEYVEMPVDLRLLKMLLSGDWEEHEFLRISAGSKICASHDERVVKCQRCC